MSTPKKETVYQGPAMPGGNSYNPAGTPVKETVYGGPGNGTAYNPAGFPPVGARSSSTHAGGKEANVFFLIAVFSLINVLLLSSGALFATAIGLGINRVLFRQVAQRGGEMGSVFLLSAVLIGIFVGLGIFARRGSSLAFLIGLALYGLDTGILCWDGIAIHIPSIIVHGIFLAGMVKGYRLTKE